MINKRDVDFVFSHEQAIREAVQEKRSVKGGHTGGSGGHCYISDPTAITAIRNIEEVSCVYIEYGPNTGTGRERKRLRYPERWLKVINWTREYYYESCRVEQGRLLDMHYRQNISREEACEQLHIGYGKYHTMLNDVLAFAVGLATGLGI